MELKYDQSENGYWCSVSVNGRWYCSCFGSTKRKAKEHALRLARGEL